MATPRVPIPPRSWQADSITGGMPGRSIVASVKVVGVPQYMRRLFDWHNQKMRAAAERGVKKATKFLLEETLLVTPFDKGDLYRSGKTDFKGHREEITGIVYFDEEIAPHGIFVHEDLTKYHKPPTIAKFLQVTQYKNRGRISQIIYEELLKVRP